jgi:ADP-ribose pyrophosphatase YjhB (NUDIX family)
LFTIREIESKNYRKLPEKSLQILLIHRNNYPFKDCWSLPGTFINTNESLDAAATRCLKEKSNISNVYLEQLYTFGEVDRDPRTRVISCTYMSLVDSSNFSLKAGKNASDIDFFTVSTKVSDYQVKENKTGNVTTYITELVLKNSNTTLSAKVKTEKKLVNTKIITNYQILKSENIAFDHAKNIIYALDRLKNKVEYTDIAFSLMPKEFTLTNLQKCYEILLDKPLLAANFRRKISHMVTETDNMTIGAGHRPSKLYKFNPDWYIDNF